MLELRMQCEWRWPSQEALSRGHRWQGASRQNRRSIVCLQVTIGGTKTIQGNYGGLAKTRSLKMGDQWW